MNNLLGPRASAALLLVCGASLAAQTAPPTREEMARRYERAAVFASPDKSRLVLNESVIPHWMAQRGAFWYARQTQTGQTYVRVCADHQRASAFDHEKIAGALEAASGTPAYAEQLRLERMESPARAVFLHEQRRFECDLSAVSCRPLDGTADDPTQAVSPDGTRALFTRGADVWIKDLASGALHALTEDGVEHFAWGAYPDSGLLAVPRQRLGGLPFPPTRFSWSPDGKRVLGSRTDERGIAPTYFLEAVPQDGSFRTKAWPARQSFMGEAPLKTETVIFDVERNTRVTVQASDLDIDEPLAWSDDGTHLLAVTQSSDRRTVSLVKIDTRSGAVQYVHSEHPPGFVKLNTLMYSAPNVRVIRHGAEVLWYSERSGYGHLYRYRTRDGALLNAVTQGDWTVRDILHVDEKEGRILFTAVGRDATDPYRRQVYRVDLDGGHLRLLTPEAGDHQIDGPPQSQAARLLGRDSVASVSPDGSVFVDTWSTYDEPPVTVLRSTTDGRILARLEVADASGLLATGWRPPIPFEALAADGVTRLHGVLYTPLGFDTSAPHSIPLVDALYGGPQIQATPHNFTEAHAGYWAARAVAMTALGVATFIVDGRGTPLRSRAFQDEAFKPNFADAGLDDHVSVVHHLTSAFAALDPQRVGVFGHSFGGYVAARAMLRHGDVYKVGVSSAGIHSASSTYSLEGFLPAPVYEGGSSRRPSVTAEPENYRVMDNGLLAPQLKGRLLLVYADLDENAPFSSTAHLVDALIKADRRFDLLYLPNRTHAFPRDPYFQRRLWDYFVAYLLMAPLP